MRSEYPIADMLVFPLKKVANNVTLLANRDHLLRRFGQLRLIDLGKDEVQGPSVRGEADRFYFVISGNASMSLTDLRDQSPTRGNHASINSTADDPQGVLIPFGVACTITASSAARVIELSTHCEGHPEDRTITPDELAQYTVAQ